MNSVRRSVIVSMVLARLLMGAATMMADEHRASKVNEEAIRKTAAAYQEASARGDAKALAAYWTADGTYRDMMGRTYKARDLVRQHYGSGTNGERSDRAVVESDSSIRFVTPDVAIEEGTFPAAGDAKGGGYTAIWVKKGQMWLLDRLQEWKTPYGSFDGPLQPLSWMIGRWVGSANDVVVNLAAEWSENEKFIIARFTIEQDGRELLTSTQRIGWDPSKRRIRSWVFDSSGGIVEGLWQREGESWIVKTSGVLSDGSRSSSISFWVPEGDDRFVLKSSHTKIGDQKIQDSVFDFQRTGAGG